MKHLKKLGLLLFITFFLFSFSPAKAQTSQNVILSCLDATMLDPITQTINGVSYHHLLSLVNHEQGIFVPNQPIYIVRSLPRTFCSPDNNDPECIKDAQNNITPCFQEWVGANTCNLNCPWEGHTCTKDNAGPGRTICCMPAYTKQGPYFECANDKNNQLVCPSSIMSEPGQNNGIHPAENGHIETGYESIVMLPNHEKDSLVADANGNIFINVAQSYTGAGLEHSFYGMQLVSDQAITNNDAFRYSLKLALFAQTETIEPSAINCTTVFWDPYGKVIDSLRLEPIYNLPILLKNLDSRDGVVNTAVANNPAFKNPELTDLAGNFNFAVIAGTYFLEPLTTDFSFPIDSNDLSRALSNLQSFDPNQDYIKRDKIYNNLTEPIVEKEGFSERRDLILQPKDQNYQGTTPIIMYAENLRHEEDQLIRGRVSHPKSLIKVYLSGTLVGQTQADLEGGFNLIIPQNLIENSTNEFKIFAEKTPLFQTAKKDLNLGRFLGLFVNQVFAQPLLTSSPYSLSLVPVRMTGFVFDPYIRVQPNSIVQLTVPSLGGINYSQTVSDENGYINITPQNLPPFEFVLNVTTPDKNNYQLTIDDFSKTNSVFFEETGENLYNTKISSTKPSIDLVKKVHAQTPKIVSPSALSINQQPIPTQNQLTNNPEQTAANNQVFMMVFLFMLLLVAIVGVIIVKRRNNKDQIYY